MKIFLHIGGVKTGTSSIQESLLQNKDLLLEQGIYYLHMKGRNEYRDLPAYCSNQGYYDHHFEINYVNNAEARQAFDKNFLATFDSKMKNIPANIHTVVLSSEHLSFQLHHQEEVERLKLLLADYSKDIEVCYYIREQVGMVSSAYSTRIKTGYTLSFEQFCEMYMANPANDYNAILQLWEHAFGQDKIKLRLYEQSEFINADLLEDFYHCIERGLAHHLNINIPQHNRSLSRLGIVFARFVNNLIPVFNHKKGVSNVNRALIKLITEHVGGKSIKPSPKQKDTIKKYFAPGNELVRKRYFPEREELFRNN